MSVDFNRIDRVTRVAPLGVRFWDAPTARPIADGLAVTVAPAGRPDRAVRAVPNGSGVFVAHDLPGLRDFSFGSGDDDTWATAPALPFVISVADTRNRFQPFWFAADLPARGLLALPCDSPASGAAAVPLFSTVARPVPAGAASIRAELWDAAADGPASWAVLEARYEGALLGRGLADRAGRVALVFGYPSPLDLAVAPVGSPPRPPTRLRWAVQLVVRHARWAGGAPPAPDLCAALNQPAATLAESPNANDEALLTYGVELVVASPARPVLLVNPAA